MSKNIEPRHYDVILSPVVTEKATIASEQNKVLFKVAAKATKPQIKEAIEKLFDVKVKSVNTLHVKGKWKIRGRTIGRTQEWKKAMVTLAEGNTIETRPGKPFFLCRCGQSSNKPFCDGTHNRIEWDPKLADR